MEEFMTAADQRVGYMGERDNVLATPERWCVQGVTMFYAHGCGF